MKYETELTLFVLWKAYFSILIILQVTRAYVIISVPFDLISTEWDKYFTIAIGTLR